MDTTYLVELAGGNCFLNHSEAGLKTFGALMNMSTKHDNVYGKYVNINGKPDMLMVAKAAISEGSQLVWNYGKDYKQFSCVSDCLKCQKKC